MAQNSTVRALSSVDNNDALEQRMMPTRIISSFNIRIINQPKPFFPPLSEALLPMNEIIFYVLETLIIRLLTRNNKRLICINCTVNRALCLLPYVVCNDQHEGMHDSTPYQNHWHINCDIRARHC